ncbi:MAG: LLM class flavin-dependent oxidoreductase [Gammaproteobacteria bacterium]|nr:LLM class flavin-dependent oxidoreductase [Gammaproteobacteria bacterium]
MDIDIILEEHSSPDQIRELAVAAEQFGIRAVWVSNYHQYWDAFLALTPAALATSKILLGPLAVSPWEMHPLKMANAILTLNEIAKGRVMLAVSGGGGCYAAIGWRATSDGEVWPPLDPTTGFAATNRRVRSVRETIEIMQHARTGQLTMGYDGGAFVIKRPFVMDWAQHDGPLLYSCSSAPMMIRMGARVADGLQLSDFTLDMMPAAMENVRAGLAKRAQPVEDFRVGNFWAWHLKPDREASMYEARRELFLRGALMGKLKPELTMLLGDADEADLVLDHWPDFRKAFFTRSGKIDGVPADIVDRLIAGLASAGDLGDLESQLVRFRQFANSGLTELSLRLHDEPMDALQVIGEHVVPAVR